MYLIYGMSNILSHRSTNFLRKYELRINAIVMRHALATMRTQTDRY